MKIDIFKHEDNWQDVKDSTMNRFELNNQECSIEELNEYINDWHLKKNIKWIKYKNSDIRICGKCRYENADN